MNKDIIDKANSIFILSNEKNIICPPSQVFHNVFDYFILTPGGYIVDNNDEYKQLMNTLKTIGENKFYILENLGATITDRKTPFFSEIGVNTTLKDFENITKFFDSEQMMIYINHWYVFGNSLQWGIYICEYPAVNIIGCTNKYKDLFIKTCKQSSLKYDKEHLYNFIKEEFHNKKQYNTFTQNYGCVNVI